MRVHRAREPPRDCRRAHDGREEHEVLEPLAVGMQARVGELERRARHVADGAPAAERLAPEPTAVLEGVEPHHVLVEPAEEARPSTLGAEKSLRRPAARGKDAAPLEMSLCLLVHGSDDSKNQAGCKREYCAEQFLGDEGAWRLMDMWMKFGDVPGS